VGPQLPPRLRRIGLWTTASAGLLLLGACSSADQDQIRRLALPEPVTDRGPAIYDLWHGAWLAAFLVGVLMWGLIGWASFVYRRRSDDEIPVQTRYNLPIEILYTVAPIVIVLVFFYYTVTVQNQVLDDSNSETGEADHQVKVVGQQWSWSFNYLDEDAVGKQDVFTVGTTADRPTLVLPVGESVDVDLVSPDVIHSFWVPAFLFKMDVVPGRLNSFSFTPTKVGTFVGRCAELCGAYHSRMLFDVDVVSAEKYDEYLRGLEAEGNVGQAVGGENAGTQPGLEDEVQDDDITNQGDAS
jgi:cytochrome c oxidase subunit II